MEHNPESQNNFVTVPYALGVIIAQTHESH